MRRRQRILVLDDDPAVCSELHDLLAGEGHEVATAGDATVLEGEQFDSIDLMVLDLGLPTVDGVDVLRRMAHLMRSPSIVMMSGHGQSVLRAATYAAEERGLRILGALEKPIDPDHLIELLDTELHAESDISPAAAADTVQPALVRALDERELKVAFQPKVRASDLRFAGAEALLAGELPDIGRISPPSIVAAAASSPGLLVRLTHEVMRQAADACACWTQAGWTGTVNVNVPIETVSSENAIAALIDISRAAGVPPQHVTLELVEDSLYDTSADVVASLAKLRIAGFGLALDDVGRRQSGLLQLANLPVTEIKIDREIVRQARAWEKARGIFASLAELGQRIGTKVVAEGVELPADLELVREHPVDFVQGFLVSAKLPLKELLARLLAVDGAMGA